MHSSHFPQPCLWIRQLFRRFHDLAFKPLHGEVQDLKKHGLLAPNVMIKGLLGQPNRPGNVTDGGDPAALLKHQLMLPSERLPRYEPDLTGLA